jgi:DNA-binding response OmpR family regulator/anti-sigma regulatory factor (Ser/Thr protein kinase)
MQRKNIRFLFASNPNQIQAYFDTDKIDKVIFNLLSNAFKYTPENGEVKIELDRNTKQAKQYLEIVISDTGIGISPEDLDKVFTRFYNNKMKEAGETNGIGLSLTKELVEIHHGAIHVTSEKDKGTVFTVEIPIDRESYSDAELGIEEQSVVYEKNIELMSVAEDEASVDAVTEQAKMNILLVDDNEELLVLIKDILARHYNVISATNGLEALTLIQTNEAIDIIVSDVIMPEMDGLELCKRLKQDLETSHIPIILLTAKNSTDDRITCYNAGADAYISKPFELKVLEARINNFLANKKNRQEKFKSDVEINISRLEYPTLDEQFLDNAIKIIEEHLSQIDLDVNMLAYKLNMSKSSLYRKIKSMTDLSPRDFIRNIRLKHACIILKDKSINVSEVAYSVGFSDPKYFTACFKSEFNITPRDYQKSVQG